MEKKSIGMEKSIVESSRSTEEVVLDENREIKVERTAQEPHMALQNLHPVKQQAYDKVLGDLSESSNQNLATELWNHFHRLPLRYAFDVSVGRAEDVLLQNNLLHSARNTNRIEVEVQAISDHKKIAGYGLSDSMREDVEREMHEITFSTTYKPELFGQFITLLAGARLNILEIHAFSTSDGYSLDIFVVDNWPHERTKVLLETLIERVSQFQEHGKIYADLDDGAFDFKLLRVGNKFASGSSADIYKGLYCNKDVAIKVFSSKGKNPEMERAYHQEISVMRKVNGHDNIVRFIGACVDPKDTSKFYIVTELMSGGSLHSHLYKGIINQKFKLPSLLKGAIDISKGMDYLHEHGIIHRDLKSANLLRDGNGMIKIADFGVAKEKNQSQNMTPETGTLTWMAPEVLRRSHYDHKVDMFSFGVVLSEMLTGELPYKYQSPQQIVEGVQKGLRPKIPKKTNPELVRLIERCWSGDPSQRPEFREITGILQQIEEKVLTQQTTKKNFLRVFRSSG